MVLEEAELLEGEGGLATVVGLDDVVETVEDGVLEVAEEHRAAGVLAAAVDQDAGEHGDADTGDKAKQLVEVFHRVRPFYGNSLARGFPAGGARTSWAGGAIFGVR